MSEDFQDPVSVGQTNFKYFRVYELKARDGSGSHQSLGSALQSNFEYFRERGVTSKKSEWLGREEPMYLL